jgi:hypothetical protein
MKGKIMCCRYTTIKCFPGAVGDMRRFEVKTVSPVKRQVIEVLARKGRTAVAIASAIFDGKADLALPELN